MATTRLEREIGEQPEVLARLLTAGREDAERVAAELRAADPPFVLLAARGSSDNAARYAQYVLGAHHGRVVALAAPSLSTVYGARLAMRGALVVGISQSGRSPDVVAVVEQARRQGAPTLALTNDPGSPLGRAAARCFAVRAGEELAIAATKSYTAELAALAMISAALSGEAARWRELEALPDAVAAAVAAEGPLQALAAELRAASRILVLGRGFNFCTAHEVALKVTETSYVLAEAHSWVDFLHGPAAMVEPGLAVVVIAPSGAVAGEVFPLFDLLDARGATSIAIADRGDVLARASAALALPQGVPEWLSPIVAVIPGQRLAAALARARGIDPDAPRGLSKITETR
jgi:glucosamine--fructose-6-phosphate aminotransferase (isomerizing)